MPPIREDVPEAERATMRPWEPRRVLIDGPIKSDDGYGHMTENLILAFDQAGFVVHCGPRRGNTDLTFVHPRVQALATQGRKRREAVGIRMSQPDSFHACPSRFKVGYSMFEYTRLPRSWVAGSAAADINVVPSRWCREVWLGSGVRVPVEVNALGVDTELFTYVDRPVRDVFTFCMTGTLNERKAPWLAWQAFQAAFPRDPHVRLVMKSTPGFPIPAVDDARITTINASWPKERMVAALHAADCFVYPTRGEGFGLSPAEAMSTGLPVICTGETSCKEFVLEAHAYPLSITGWESVPSPWGDVGELACPSLDHLVALMRHVSEHRDEARERGRRAAAYVRAGLTWRHTVERLIRIVETYL